MAHVYTTVRIGDPQVDFAEASIYEKPDGQTRVQKETGDKVFDRRTQMLKYRRRLYMIGTWARPRMRDEFGTYRSMGVRPPMTRPTMVDAAVPGSSEGNMIGYQTFVVKVGDKKIAESNPGPATDTLESGGLGRFWDNIDWSPQDAYVNWARGYVSVDGSIPALAWERPIAPGTTVSEAVATGALGVTLPVRKGLSGYYAMDRYARGIPPYTKYAEEYHDAIFYAGDPDHPERIYYSKLFEPEAVNSTPTYTNGRLDEPWLSTTDGDAVTGIKRQGDELVVGTYRGIDVIQGYTYGDFSIRRVSNYWGVTSHFSMRRAGPLGSLFFSAPQGPTLYNAGSFRYLGEPISTWWRDEYRTDQSPFDDAFGVEDRYWGTYNLLLPQTDDSSLWLVLDYNSAEYGQPVWVFDIRARKDWVSEELAVDSTSNYYERYTGSCDGAVRQENVETDADDDGDAYQKKWTVQTPHRFMGDQGGHEAEGFAFKKSDVFLKHEQNDAVVSFYAGDDDSPNAATPHWSKTLPSTGAGAGQRTRTARTGEHLSLTKTSGKGVTLKIEVTAPLDVQFRGWGMEFAEGPAGDQPYK